jgi:hypothetical protein
MDNVQKVRVRLIETDPLGELDGSSVMDRGVLDWSFVPDGDEV